MPFFHVTFVSFWHTFISIKVAFLIIIYFRSPQVLLEAAQEFCHPLDAASKEAEARVRAALEEEGKDRAAQYTELMAADVAALWQDSGVQQCLERKAQLSVRRGRLPSSSFLFPCPLSTFPRPFPAFPRPLLAFPSFSSCLPSSSSCLPFSSSCLFLSSSCFPFSPSCLPWSYSCLSSSSSCLPPVLFLPSLNNLLPSLVLYLPSLIVFLSSPCPLPAFACPFLISLVLFPPSFLSSSHLLSCPLPD